MNWNVLLFVCLATHRLWAGQATPSASIVVLEGFQVELLKSADESESSWISMTFDDRGRLILGLDDVGIARVAFEKGQPTTFERIETTLQHCRGVLYAYDSLYVSATDSKGFYRLRDTNGDDHFDQVELLKAMDYQSRYGHGTNQITLGPDGMLYLACGNDVSYPEGYAKDSPYREAKNDWLLTNSHDLGYDERVGQILQVDQDGHQWRVIAGGLRNQVDIAFNIDGEMFTYDADMEYDVGLPWYRPTRLNHIVSGGEYGWRWGSGKWPVYFPDSLPTTLDTGLGSPTGIVFGTGSHFPARFRHGLFMADWQNGRILFVQLTPRGATYRGEYELFIEGGPLNVCDMVFGEDGSLYFITGGRGSQSGLYRVTYVGEPSTEEVSSEPIEAANGRSPRDARDARDLRRRLEAFHGEAEPHAVDFLWPYLADDDRWIRFAARVALERQDLADWRQRALSEPRTDRALHALLALARVGTQRDQAELLSALDSIELNELNAYSLLTPLRTYALSFSRQGPPDEPSRDKLVSRLQPLFPHQDVRVNQELGELLVYLKAPGIHEMALDRIEVTPSQEEQIHHARAIVHLPENWSLESQRRMLQWLRRARGYRGGQFMQTAVSNIRADFLESIDDQRKRELATLIDESNESQPAVVATSQRPFLRDWQLEDILPDLETLNLTQRTTADGKRALVVALCLNCHRVGTDGANVGPDLTHVGGHYDARKIWESIVEPSQTVDPKYRNRTYAMDDGRMVTGRVVHVDGSELVIETDPVAATTAKVERAAIESSTVSQLSPMPSGLVNSLSKEEILDLLFYLSSGLREEMRSGN